jgi:hypothetical protein
MFVFYEGPSMQNNQVSDSAQPTKKELRHELNRYHSRMRLGGDEPVSYSDLREQFEITKRESNLTKVT